MARLLGLAGPPGAGKSTVLEWMRGHGTGVFDADRIVGDLLTQDRNVIASVAARFGEGILTDDVVDRPRLARIVFADAAALADLESLIHPAVTARVISWEKGLAQAVGVLEAIKLTRSSLLARCEALWVVACDLRVRKSRLLARGWSEDEIVRRTSTAPPMAELLPLAAEVIDNSGPWPHTEVQLEAAWARFAPGGVP
jgi:dephospho-CoA kinase